MQSKHRLSSLFNRLRNLGSDNRFRKRQNSENLFQIEKLEPRMMLNGDPGELIFQAGFEDVTVPVGEFRFFQNVSGFTATVNPVEVQNNSPAVGPSSEGKNLLELDGTNGVFVEISEVPADGLLLQGDYSARRGFDAVQNTIEILWNGEVVSTLANDGSKLKSTEFSEFEITLSGENSTGRLEFRSTTVNDPFGAGGLLDDIKLFKFANDSQSPTLQAIGDQTLAVGEPYSVQLVATDPDSDQSQLRFSATRAPAGSTLDPVSGVFQWTPASSAAGLRFSVEVQVTDETGLTDSKSFRLTVENDQANLPPVLERIEDVTVDERQLVSIQLVASDPDSSQDQLRYSTLRAPVGSSIDSTTGLFTWTPNAYAGGLRFGIDVQVTDETGLSDTKTFRVTVNDVVENIAPVLAEVEDREVNQGDLLSVQFTATDEDSSQDQLRYAALRSPIGSSLDPVSGLFTWTPNAFARGLTFGIDIQVTDETGLTDVQTFRVAVAEADSRAPVLALIEDQTTTARQTIRVQLVATDNDSQPDQLRYSALRSPIGSVLDPESGLFSWTPNSSAAGLRFGIDVRVTDETGLSDTKTFRISVDESDGLAPVLGDIENQTISAGELINVQLTATDADSDLDDLRFTALRSPVGSTLDPVTGLFRWTPNSFAEGLTFGVDVQVTDETGRSDKKTFKIEVQEETGEILLIETQDFETVATRSITIDEAINELEIDFDASFDRQDVDSINDAFEIALLDLDGNSLVHTFDNKRDSFFNHTEGEAPVGGVNTVVMGQKVKLDLSHIAVGTTANLVFRLVNNDQDTHTQVRITSIATSDNLLNTPAGAAVSSDPTRDNKPNDFGRLSDVTGSLAIDYGQTSFNQFDGTLFSKIKFTNIGQVAITGRMLAVFDNPTSEQISLLQPDGRLPDGRFFIEVASENGRLLAGETTVSQNLALRNRTDEQFGFELTILAEVNNAPAEFTSVPPTAIEAGRTLKYTAVAIDPDEGQILRYTIVQGDPAISIGETTGELSWLTTTDDIGANLVTIRATDPYGLYVEQAFTVDVMQSLQNRPPNFVTDPVTDATASSGFEVTTVAAGDGPTGVTVVDGFRGPGLVTLNAGDQSLSQIDSLGNDRFDLPIRVSVGEPAPTGQVLRSGYSVDVGLPAFESTFDRNAISGMDQADLNGDGTLDLVVSGLVFDWLPSQSYQQLVNVTLGNPDGTFGEAITVGELPANGSSKYSTLRVADFDNDGHFDILTTDRETSIMYFLRGDGQGDFADAVAMTLATNLYNFKSVDLDQDGNLDLVGMSSTQKELGYMLGGGDGTFDDFATVYGDPAGPLISSFIGPARSYAVADMDGDGDRDIVLGDFGELSITVMSNDGALGFSVAATLDAISPFYPYASPGPPGQMFAVFVGDFNGDSHEDIAYGSRDGSSGRSGGLGVYLGDGSGANFTYQDGADAIVNFPDNAAGNGDPVDIDNDGDLDIVVASSSGGNSSAGQMPSVLINRGDGTFTTTNLTLPAFGESSYALTNNESNAKGVLVGDYNQDGLLDISTYRSHVGGSFASVTVILADQPGVFASSSTLLSDFLVNSPKAFYEAGDFNNDGIVDLWAPSYQGISRTWLGRGDGTFDDPFPATPSIGNEFLTSGTVEDFNQDGILDVFWNGLNGVQGGPAPRYLAALGNGDGTFEITFQQSSGGRQPDWSDFNGDGYLDFASSNTTADGVHVYLYDVDNPGTWVFNNEIFYSDLGPGATGYGYTMSVDDFDQDGKSDIGVVARLTNEPFRLVVYPGLGDGTFTTPVSTFIAEAATDYTSTSWMTTGDFNEDGIPDVAVYEYYSISVHLGVGDGTFGRTDIYPAWRTANIETQLFVRDINHDGHDDVLFSDVQGSQSLGILLGNGDGSFQDRIAYDVPNSYGAFSFGDFDNDGREDFVANGQTLGNFATILNGARQRLTDIVSVDLNGDGNDDVLATNTDNSRVKWFLGDNLGNLNRQPDLFTDFGPVALTVADLDSNGDSEIITANRSARSISIFSGDFGNWTRNDISVGQAPIDVISGLVDSDAAADLLVIDEANNALWVLMGNGDMTFSEPVAIPLGDRPNDFLLADVDADGNNDVVISLPDSNRIMILPGDGLGGFTAPQYVTLEGSPSAIAAVDFNQDGKLDLSATLSDLGQVAIIYGRGQFQFARPQLIAVGDNPVAMSAEDVDDDGRFDLIVSNQGDDTVSVIYNRFDPNEVYRYDADAVDPDDDPLTYAIVDGPGGLIINSETGALLWAASPDQVGEHSVTISADDGRGGVATQTYKIDVQPARENATPLFASEAETTIGANEIFTYQATALDSDNDAIRYRLLDGPTGATIDPTTGLVTWDGRGEARKFTEFGENGSIRVAADESFQTPSVTVEGWFNIHTLTASNGAAELFKQQNRFDNTYRLRLLFNNQIEFQTRYENELVTYRMPFIQETDRWYHIALTIDDATHTATIYVDGEVIGEKALPSTIEYGEDHRYLELTGGRATVDHFRVWSVARSQAEIQQGMAEQYDDNPLVTLDYRFDNSTSYSAYDSSQYGNAGYLTAAVPQQTVGLTVAGERSFAISVEDGRGGFDTQTFVLDVLPEQRGSIVGHLFDDLNGDGDQDDGSENGVPSEPSLQNWHLYIDTNGNAYPDPSELQTVTDADGNYRFEQLLPGEYPVRISPVAGFDVPTAPSQQNVTANTETALDLALQQFSLSHIRGQLQTENGDAIAFWEAYADLNEDGRHDDNEPIAITDRDGNYALTGLTAGTYKIRTELPAGWNDIAGPDGLLVTLSANEISAGNDFTVEPSNTSVTGGIHFVTRPVTNIEARQTFRYASVAMGIANQAMAYDLSLAPDGMTVDPRTGLTAWRPAIDQVGEHLVILRATDATGSISLHDFTLTVTAPNTPPVVLPPNHPFAYVGMNYVYDVIAQDAESTELTYALTQSPAGSSIDPNTGRLSWLPAVSAVGLQQFTVKVTDEAGQSTSEVWSLEVKNETPAALPLSLSLPRSTAAVTTDYFSRIEGRDAISRPVTWGLTSAPTGVTVASDGTIEWKPSADQLGAQTIELAATTADGDIETVSFEVEVKGRTLNASPSIDSVPVTSISLGQAFTYDVQVSDTDRDIHAFTLLDGPVGMSIHPSLGLVRWMPAADQLGEHDVLIQVSDHSGATDEQEIKLKVSRFGGPPRIASVPPTEASVGTAFLYSVVAIDQEGDPLTYTLLTAPTGVSIEQTTGEIAWTPTSGQVGQQDIVIQVSDGIGGAATQAFAINVSAGAANLPPEITSTSPRFGAVGTAYSYTLIATDPENTALTYRLGRGPDGMTIDAGTGLVSWTPMTNQVGQHVVTLIATDAGGASAIESFEFDVLAQNTLPTIDSNAPVDVVAGKVFMYDLLASDADVDQLQFVLIEGPTGAVIDRFGRIRWQTEVAFIGSHDFTVKVSDPRGGEAVQSFTLAVIEDSVAPKLSAIVFPGESSVGNKPWGTQFRVYARATDDVAIALLSLSANGQDIPLDASGTAEFTFEQWGFATITATATAIDTNGNSTTKTITFGYDFPEGWNGIGGDEIPTAIISSPSDTASVTGMVSITGTAAHDDFAAYKLSYRHVDETSFTEFYESTTAVTNGELGMWDTSMLRNDEYIIRLQVVTTDAVVNVVDVNVGLAGELKLGNFQLSFTDMVIPVAGIPIEITRVYDTLQADVEGEFGFGWRLEFRDTDLRVGLPKSGLENIGIFPALKAGVKVYLNVPGEGRQGFTFNPDIRVLPGYGGNNLVLARPRFTADPGVTSTLSTGISNYLQVNEYGELFAPGGIPYNPASPDFGGAYVLTSEAGITYRIDGASGKLASATDRNGNRLTFSDNGVVGDSGRSIEFKRDAQGRISAIQDPLGNQVGYRYSPDGNLLAFTDREGNTVSHEYNSIRSHYLTDVIDPLNRPQSRSVYDDDGRLIQSIDVNNNSVSLNYDIDDSIIRSTDALGNDSIVLFDNYGNVTSTVDELGNQTTYEHDSSNNLVSVTLPSGRKTVFTWDSRNQLLSETNNAGSASRLVYDSQGFLTAQIDSTGAATNFENDSNGNVVSVRSASGDYLEYQRDAAGRITSETTSTGVKTILVFSGDDLVEKVLPDGLTIEFENDLAGTTTKETFVLTTLNGEVEQTWEYVPNANGEFNQIESGDLVSTTSRNELGQIEEVTNSAGQRQTATYDNAGRIESIDYDNQEQILLSRDALGRVTSVEGSAASNSLTSTYDAAGRVIQSQLGDVIITETHDKDGRVTNRTNSNGESISYQYDSAGFLSRETFEASGRESVVFDYMRDSEGRVTETLRNGTLEQKIDFDDSGLATKIEFDDGTFEEYQRNTTGNIVRKQDRENRVWNYSYDDVGNLVEIVEPGGGRVNYEYDSLGNTIAIIDALGNRTEVIRDGLGRITGRVLADGSQESYEFDEQGRTKTVRTLDDQVLDFTFDEQNRILTASRDGTTVLSNQFSDSTQTAQGLSGTTTITRNDAGFVTSWTDPLGNHVDNIYTLGESIQVETENGSHVFNLGSEFVASIVDSFDLGGSQTLTTNIDRNTIGLPTSIELPNGLTWNAIRDSSGLILGTSFTDQNGNVSNSRNVERVGSGRVSSITTDDTHTNYSFDDSGRLASESFENTANSTRRSQHYEYDFAGNRIATVRDGVRYDHTFDERNRIVQTTANDSVVETFVHNDRGDLTKQVSDERTVEYKYDAENRLIEVRTTAAGVLRVVAYTYDFDGILLTRTIDNQVEHLIWDRATVAVPFLAEVHDDQSQVKRRYTHDGARYLYRVDGQGQIDYLVTDRLGSVVSVIGRDGQLLENRTTSAFGVPIVEQSGDNLVTGFAGGLFDQATGLVYLNSRWYDPALGRFTQSDAADADLNSPATLNRYVYAGGDPVGGVDRDGYFTLSETQQTLFVYSTIATIGVAAGGAFFTSDYIVGKLSGGKATFKNQTGFIRPFFEANLGISIPLGAGVSLGGGLVGGLENVTFGSDAESTAGTLFGYVGVGGGIDAGISTSDGKSSIDYGGAYRSAVGDLFEAKTASDYEGTFYSIAGGLRLSAKIAVGDFSGKGSIGAVKQIAWSPSPTSASARAGKPVYSHTKTIFTAGFGAGSGDKSALQLQSTIGFSLTYYVDLTEFESFLAQISQRLAQLRRGR